MTSMDRIVPFSPYDNYDQIANIVKYGKEERSARMGCVYVYVFVWKNIGGWSLVCGKRERFFLMIGSTYVLIQT